MSISAGLKEQYRRLNTRHKLAGIVVVPVALGMAGMVVKTACNSIDQGINWREYAVDETRKKAVQLVGHRKPCELESVNLPGFGDKEINYRCGEEEVSCKRGWYDKVFKCISQASHK